MKKIFALSFITLSFSFLINEEPKNLAEINKLSGSVNVVSEIEYSVVEDDSTTVKKGDVLRESILNFNAEGKVMKFSYFQKSADFKGINYKEKDINYKQKHVFNDQGYLIGAVGYHLDEIYCYMEKYTINEKGNKTGLTRYKFEDSLSYQNI